MTSYIMIRTQSVCETHDITVWVSSRQDWIGKISIGILKTDSSTREHVRGRCEWHEYISEIRRHQKRKKNTNNTWLHICEEIPHKKTISCTKFIAFKNVRKFPFKLTCKKENQVQLKVQGLQELKEDTFIVHRHTDVNKVTQTITEALKTE